MKTSRFRDNGLPVSNNGAASNGENGLVGLRRRLSSLSVHIQPLSTATAEWALRRTKSVPSFPSVTSGPLRRWWDRSVGWFLSRKLPPAIFTRDMEMNEEEVVALGITSRGTWRHALYKMRSEIRKLLLLLGRSDHASSLPVKVNVMHNNQQKFRYEYESFNSAKPLGAGEKLVMVH